MEGKIIHIFISPEACGNMKSVNRAILVSGKGIEGDRYFSGIGTFSEKLKNNPAAELTLIEKEQIDKFNKEHKLNLGYGEFRRNIVTEGIGLNELVGKTFCVGKVKVKGIRLCEPCAHLAETVNELVLPYLVGCGGLRAQILSNDIIEIGNSING